MRSVPNLSSDDQVLVRVPEPLTLINVPAVIAAVEDALAWTPWLVLDLVDVRHVDAAGADVLLWACNEARRRCGDAYLVGVAPAVRATPEWCRLSAIATQPRLERVPHRLPRQTARVPADDPVPAGG